MNKFLLIALATLSISPCVSETIIKSSNSKNLIENNNDSIVSEQNKNAYTIRFLNDEGSLISTKQYEFGAMPEAPDAPSKENPLEGYTYTFSGWSPSIALVTANADYVATYKAEAKTGEVIWVDGDGKTLSTDTYAYGSMPCYHGDIPTKTPTDTEIFVFKGWSPEVEIVSKSTTYVATFNAVPIVPETQYSIRINCTNCLVNKKRLINEKYNPLTDLVYQFNNISDEIYHYPYKLDVTVNGESTNDYIYDNLTGKLNIKLTGNTIINAIADNSCVLMKYEYSADYPTVGITCGGEFEYVDWGDGTKDTNNVHTYSLDSNVDQYDIRIFGKLSNIGTTSKFVTSVNVFHSVTSIGEYAFKGCSALTSITIPNSVTSISWHAFEYCSKLASIALPYSVISIGSYAFNGCSALNSITIPGSVTSIGEYAFWYCSHLVIYCETGSKPSGWYSTWNNNCYCEVVWGCIGNGEYNNLKYGVSLMRNNKKIIIVGLVDETATSAIIPSTIRVNGEDIAVTSIGEYAFEYCSKLASITIPDSVISIGRYAFGGCSALTSITIPHSVASIGEYAFNNCSKLASITIPDSVTLIDENTFHGCSSLTSITIPNSVTSIGSGAFYGCSSLQYYTYDNAKYLGNESNHYVVLIEPNDKNITNCSIDSNCKIIYDGAFDYCSSLVSITIPDGVISIGGGAFYGCSSLQYYTYDNAKYLGNESNHYVVLIEANDKNITNCSIDSNCKIIYDSAFHSCSKLASITIPNSVTSIGEYAFCNCSSLTFITIPSSVTSIGEGTFSKCSSLTFITIPSSVTSIGYRAFHYCSKLASITIPSSVTSINNNAFEYCSSLAIYCETGSKPFGWYSRWNYSDCNVVWNCIGNGEYNNLKYGVSLMGNNKIIIIAGLVDKTATSAIIPSTIRVNEEDIAVTSIGEYAFSNCSSLTSITIPDSVISIGHSSFCKCSSLSLLDLSCCNHIVSAAAGFLSGTKNTLQIKVKTGLLEYYKVAPNWSNYADKIIGG